MHHDLVIVTVTPTHAPTFNWIAVLRSFLMGGDSEAMRMSSMLEKPTADEGKILCTRETFNKNRVGAMEFLQVTRDSLWYSSVTERV